MTFQTIGNILEEKFLRSDYGFGQISSWRPVSDTIGASIFRRILMDISPKYSVVRTTIGPMLDSQSEPILTRDFSPYRDSTEVKTKSDIYPVEFNQFIRYTFDFNGRPQYGLLGANLNAQFREPLFQF